MKASSREGAEDRTCAHAWLRSRMGAGRSHGVMTAFISAQYAGFVAVGVDGPVVPVVPVRYMAECWGFPVRRASAAERRYTKHRGQTSVVVADARVTAVGFIRGGVE